MKAAAIREEAERLVLEFGTDAYTKAREAMREARRRRNAPLERFFSKVSIEVARRAGREVGVDTATRYIN